jgi:hypothetical protein
MKKKSNPKKKASTRKGVAGKKKAKKKNATKITTYVLAPGGYRPEELVKKAPASKKGRDAHFKKLKKAPDSEAAGKRFALINNAQNFLEELEPARLNSLNPHWMAVTGFRNDSAAPISRFTAKLVVPEAPQKKTQLIYIFLGMENSDRILQPILQWGSSKMGGGQFWSIGSCYAGGQNDPVIFQHEMVPVLIGEELTAVIELTDRTASGCRYNCFFEENNKTLLPTAVIPELKISWVTLESYRVQNRNEYPPPPSVVFTDIKVIDINNNVIKPSWNSPDRTGPFGEHATLTREPGQPDRINLFF